MYEVFVRIEDGEEYATEFVNDHTNEINDMGLRPVYFEDTGKTVLLREVENGE